jgi:amino acid transporter
MGDGCSGRKGTGLSITTPEALPLNYARARSGLKRLTLLPLIGVTYCMVAGGPYGLEDLVHSSGYRNAILILLITPILWSFPVTLMVSELSSALPQEGGYYIWVKRGMGPFWGFQEAWLSFAASIFDMAVYPTLFVQYLAHFWPGAMEGERAWMIGIALIAICVAMNLWGIKPVGAGSLLMTLLILAPFVVVMAFAATPHFRGAAHSEVVKMDLLGGVLVAMWNYMGWDNASTIAGEVDRPQRTYPLAMLASVLLVAITYILPIAAVSRTGIPADSWETGSWVTAGRTIGQAIAGPRTGQILAFAIMAGGMISALSMFNALILSYSRVPLAMAADGFLPKVMGRLSPRTRVPWVSILVCAVGWACCLKLTFLKLLILDTIMYGLSLLLEFGALIALRIREPNLHRPYKVPGGIIGCILISLGPIPVIVVAFIKGLSDGDGVRMGMILAAVSVVLGAVLYFIIAAVNPRVKLREPLPVALPSAFPVIFPDQETSPRTDRGDTPQL